MDCADSAEFGPNSTHLRAPTERAVDFPAPSTPGVEHEARLRMTVLINFGHVAAAGLGTALTSSGWFARRMGSGDRLTAQDRARGRTKSAGSV